VEKVINVEKNAGSMLLALLALLQVEPDFRHSDESTITSNSTA